MKISLRKAAAAEDPRQQKDTTKETGAGMERRVHRRIEVTVEREVLSMLIRNPAGDALSGAADYIPLWKGATAPGTPTSSRPPEA
jgi:hypothetical protein